MLGAIPKTPRQELGMIRVDLQISKEQRLAARLVASTIRFYGYEHGINLFESFCVVDLHNPPLLRCAVLIKNAQVESLLHVPPAAAPRLKGLCIRESRLMVEIVGVEDQGSSLSVENAPAGLLGGPVPSNVIHFRDVKVARPHQVANIAIVREQFVLLV